MQALRGHREWAAPRTYLKAPTVFGFHGVYRTLAQHARVVDRHELLAENGPKLLKTWEHEQGLDGFLDSVNRRQMLRDAVRDGLRARHTDRGPGWQGWQFIADRLAPDKVGKGEAPVLRALLHDASAETRSEVFQLMEREKNSAFATANHEAALVRHLLSQASVQLAPRLKAIIAFEEFCTLLESGFDWLRWLSSRAGAQAVGWSEFAAEPEVRKCAEALSGRLHAAEQALQEAPPRARAEFAEVARYFETVADARAFYTALLHRHDEVQKAKPPEGKRLWFEQSKEGAVFVRIPYRLDERPGPRDWWLRPYRFRAVHSFCCDLNRG